MFQKISSKLRAVFRRVYSIISNLLLKYEAYFYGAWSWVLYSLCQQGNVYFHQNFLVNSLIHRKKKKKFESKKASVQNWEDIHLNLHFGRLLIIWSGSNVSPRNTNKILIRKPFQHINWRVGRIALRVKSINLGERKGKVWVESVQKINIICWYFKGRVQKDNNAH